MYQLANQADLEDLCICCEIQIWDRYDYLDSSYNSVMAYDNDLSGLSKFNKWVVVFVKITFHQLTNVIQDLCLLVLKQVVNKFKK